MPRWCSANSPNFELGTWSRDAHLSVPRLVSLEPLRVDRLQLLNSLLAVTETHDHLEDVVTHGSLQVRHDKLRNRMATLRGCVRRVASSDIAGLRRLVSLIGGN